MSNTIFIPVLIRVRVVQSLAICVVCRGQYSFLFTASIIS
jgi:hypothetical protein